MEFIPPTNRSVFVIYITSQDDGVVTASSDFVGENQNVRRIGLEALNYLYASSISDEKNLYVSPSVSSLQAQ